VVTYTYNARGQVARLKGFARSAVAANAEVGAAVPDVDLDYGYDPLGRLQTVKNNKVGGSNVSTNWYDLAGNLTETSYPNSDLHRWEYTEQNRMKATVLEKIANNTVTTLRRYDYTLNAGGMRTAVAEKDSATTAYRNVEWKYDYADPKPLVGVTTVGTEAREYRADLPKLNRLTHEAVQFPATASFLSADYSYDLVGNR
jgi:YD repeat-containing protein